MIRRQDRRRFLDILAYARRARRHVEGVPRERFETEPTRQDAVSWCLLVVGEAANRLSVEAREAMPAIPWRQVIAMRHRLDHEYDFIRVDIVWDTVDTDLIPLIDAVQARLDAAPPDPDGE